eukprot:scaffold169012_cov25-Tisochrysis_lutea.AAC.3
MNRRACVMLPNALRRPSSALPQYDHSTLRGAARVSSLSRRLVPPFSAMIAPTTSRHRYQSRPLGPSSLHRAHLPYRPPNRCRRAPPCRRHLCRRRWRSRVAWRTRTALFERVELGAWDAGIDKRRGDPLPPCASCATNAVHVRVEVGREVIIDDVANVGDVKTARGDVGGYENGGAEGAEGGKRLLPLLLRAVTMNRRHRNADATELGLQHVGALLRCDEDECEGKLALGLRARGLEQSQERTLLVALLHVLKPLRDELRGGAHAAYGNAHIVAPKVARKSLDLGRIGGGEEQCLSLAGWWHG